MTQMYSVVPVHNGGNLTCPISPLNEGLLQIYHFWFIVNLHALGIWTVFALVPGIYIPD